MVVDIIHLGQPSVSKSTLKQKLATLYEAAVSQISLFGLRAAFGGRRTTLFACIYDSVEARMKFDAKHRLVRAGLVRRVERRPKQNRSHFKNRRKMFRGTQKLVRQFASGG
ncbi:hypothetical protein O1611_g917 [Lasiodiplodia mahajangana]|uniref:Uncharacterized protein n=1 Tax=Lasiodiplodia mahajangana TaxID=1108764 RepID=A0ACC2JYW0_9PEZI|nr:hypothetical protein O1611_g917 [Lasiodiplodia mahajangana]